MIHWPYQPSGALIRSAPIGVFAIWFASVAVAVERPNIVWINAEDMSPHLGCYGDPIAQTPNIDRLAARGVVYREAFATAPICSPSRSCLATGLYATSLGTQHLRCEVKRPERVTPLPARLRELGYYCTIRGKTDYNFDASGLWDRWASGPAPWRRRASPEQPFYAFITVGETHEGPTNSQQRYATATADLPDELRCDPAEVRVPPFYPDTPEVRRTFANLYDLAAVFDRKVGEVIGWLEEDGDLDNTILFVFADHGNGLPRYKRWLNDSGLRVPLVIYAPPRWASLLKDAPGEATDRMVSFVDFPATALSLAGAEPPGLLQGEAFLGTHAGEPRELVFGARSRADDMFEMSRSVYDGRYLYVRHFLPHLPYIQESVIFDDRKRSFRELRRLHRAGELPPAAEALWAPRKPVEELYDLRADPHELNNLAHAAELAQTKQRLAKRLRDWMADHRDSGLLPEAEYQARAAAAGLCPFDVVQDPERFDLTATLEAAWRVGDRSVPIDKLLDGLNHQEAGVRYWSCVALQERSASESRIGPALTQLLEDPSDAVRIAAAETLVSTGDPARGAGRTTPALDTLAELLVSDAPWVQLHAARALTLLGERAAPLAPLMARTREGLLSPNEPGRYRDFNYASFTGWTLETALEALAPAQE